jgi:uncharacterized protein YdcH (DUF465 family)
MPTDADDIKLRLLDSHAELRQLASQHQDLDQRLSSLSTKPYLTDDEQVEEVTLKKKKLQLKDRMEDILRRHREMLGAPTPAPSSAGSAARG